MLGAVDAALVVTFWCWTVEGKWRDGDGGDDVCTNEWPCAIGEIMHKAGDEYVPVLY